MTPAKIKQARAIAKAFIIRADAYQKAQAELEAKYHVAANTPREAGALKRASMELTRALATMRNGRDR